jgi:hypothetical protein
MLLMIPRYPKKRKEVMTHVKKRGFFQSEAKAGGKLILDPSPHSMVSFGAEKSGAIQIEGSGQIRTISSDPDIKGISR